MVKKTMKDVIEGIKLLYLSIRIIEKVLFVLCRRFSWRFFHCEALIIVFKKILFWSLFNWFRFDCRSRRKISLFSRSKRRFIVIIKQILLYRFGSLHFSWLLLGYHWSIILIFKKILLLGWLIFRWSCLFRRNDRSIIFIIENPFLFLDLGNLLHWLSHFRRRLGNRNWFFNCNWFFRNKTTIVFFIEEILFLNSSWSIRLLWLLEFLRRLYLLLIVIK